MSYESSGSGSSEHEEPLSATAMFLRSLEEPSVKQPEPKPEASWPVTSAPAARPQAEAGPGEFTRMFQAAPRQETAAAPPMASSFPEQGPAPSQGAGPGLGQGLGQAPGEFTRIFYAESVSREAKTVIEPPPYVAPAAPLAAGSSRKGFSTPGVSDSASGEGSV
ncbi:MAG TPA: hypothetical protein VIM62_06135, partial [Acidobacteriaceae bacterium]